MTDTMTPQPEVAENGDLSGEDNSPAEATTPDLGTTSGTTPTSSPQTGDIPTGPEKKPTGIKGEIKQIADNYVIPMSDAAIDEWAKILQQTDEPKTDEETNESKPVSSGSGDSAKAKSSSPAKPEPKPTDAFTEYAKQVAAGLYPTLAPQIQLGITTKALLDPYVQIAQMVLGPMMTEPNWADPKWGKALQGGTDPKTGRPIPMTLNEWEANLRSDPSHGWDKTPEAHQMVQRFGSALNQAFGGEGGQS